MSGFDPIGTVGRLVGDFFASPIVQLVLGAIVVYAVVLWLATAWWVFADTSVRTRSRVAPYAATILLVLLFGPFLFPFGALLYRMLRPGERHTERLEREYTLEALVREVGPVTCPRCVRPIAGDWIICPSCRCSLRPDACRGCGQAVEFDWAVCARCGRSIVLPDGAL